MNHLDEWLQRIGEVLAILVLVFGPIWAYARKKIAKRLAALDALVVAVALLTAENENNGGKSMRDLAEKTEKTVAGLSESLNELGIHVARLTGRFDEFSRINH